MPYDPNPDDATQPTIDQLASTAAEEFRVLKEKVNKLFLTSSFNDADNTVGITRGLTLINAGSFDPSMQGLLVAANKDGGTGSVAAAFVSTVLANNVNLAATSTCVGLTSECWTSETNCKASNISGMSAINALLVQRNSTGQEWARGLRVIFGNRQNITSPVVGGIGSNLFNHHAVGISIDSQRRSSAGERCGWIAGIRFEDYCLDIDTVGAHPVAIDFTGLGLQEVEAVHFNFNAGRIITAVSTNTGSVAMPTILSGFIRVSIDGNPNFGIPIVSLAAPV